jgi:hypothetical protein
MGTAPRTPSPFPPAKRPLLGTAGRGSIASWPLTRRRLASGGSHAPLRQYFSPLQKRGRRAHRCRNATNPGRYAFFPANRRLLGTTTGATMAIADPLAGTFRGGGPVVIVGDGPCPRCRHYFLRLQRASRAKMPDTRVCSGVLRRPAGLRTWRKGRTFKHETDSVAARRDGG